MFLAVHDGFEDTTPTTTRPPWVIIYFFIAYVCSTLLLTIPIVFWKDKPTGQGRQNEADANPAENIGNATVRQTVDGNAILGGEQELVQTSTGQIDQQRTNQLTSTRLAASQPPGHGRGPPSANNGGDRATSGTGTASLSSSEVDDVTASRLRNDFEARIAPASSVSEPSISARSDQVRRSYNNTTETESVTGRSRRRNSRTWNIASNRNPWGHGRPIGRADLVRNSLEAERQSMASEEGSHASRRSGRSNWVAPGMNPRARSFTVSDAASSILSSEMNENEADFYRQRYIRRSRSRLRGPPSESDQSLMPPLSPDVLSPADAADAHDVGRVNRPEDYLEHERQHCCSGCIQVLWYFFDKILDLAEHDYEMQRLLSTAAPSSIGAVADPLFRLLLVAIISNLVDTDSMAAYLIVTLLLRLTSEEISGAVTDVETNLVKESLGQGGDFGFYEAGRAVQLALMIQCLVAVPLLLVWTFFTEEVTYWLMADRRIASIASSYAQVVVIEYILRGFSRVYLLPFHLGGQAASFERNVDVISAVLAIVTIGVVTSAAENPDALPKPMLYYIGWIQVILEFAKSVVKVAYVVLKGWLQPYQRGLFQSKSFVVCQPTCSGLLTNIILTSTSPSSYL